MVHELDDVHRAQADEQPSRSSAVRRLHRAHLFLLAAPGPQPAARFTSSPIRASPAAVSFVSAKAVGHMVPSSRFALSLKPKVAYRALNFCALWKKQTTLPSLAYAGIPYQSFGARPGALALTTAWIRSAMARSPSSISAILATTAASSSAVLSAREPRRADAFTSLARSFIAARSSSVNVWFVVVVFLVPAAMTVPPGLRMIGDILTPHRRAVHPHAPAICRVVALSRLNRFVTPIIRTMAASCFSSK